MTQQQDSQHSKDAIKSRDACKNSEAGNSSRDNRHITASTAEGRPATAMMPEIVETTNNSTSTAGTPTAQFNNSRDFAEIRQKVVKTAKNL
jgi:hypothetical protein